MGNETIGLGNRVYTKLNFLNARVVLSTVPGLDVYQWKQSKDVDWYVHLTHSIGSGQVIACLERSFMMLYC